MSNKQEAKVFTFNENNKPIRVELVDGEPWFVAKDVCDALGIENNRNATARLDEDEKGASIVRTPSGEQSMTTVNESGLYNLILQSRKPEAKKFRKWVTGEVLPSIRKTGRYEVAGQNGLAGQNGSAGQNGLVGQNGSAGNAVVVKPRRSRSELVNADLLNLLWLIGESLRQGEIREVALELGVSRQTVSKVLNGYARNPRVLMALYNRAKANRACGVIYHRPDVMAERLIDAESGDVVVQLPSVVYGSRKKGGQIGNQNARKHWRKEGK